MILRETHTVPDGAPSARLSDYARGLFEALPSRKSVAKAIKRGELLIDGESAESGRWVAPGQRIELIDRQPRPPRVFPLQLEVALEDDQLAVVHKPAGFEVSGNRFKTIQNALPHNLAASPLPDALPWPIPVHRLDYSTSGLLLVAKTAGAAARLGQAFEERRVHKRYRAVVMGKIERAGTVESPINGQPARSEYAPIESVRSLHSGHMTLVDLFPVTGRTHQLRIHMDAIDHPIVGDNKYGEPGNILRGKGLFLAAVELTFPHPESNQEVTTSLPTPRKFESLLNREKTRWEKFNGSNSA